MTEEELKNYEKEIKMEEEFKNRKIEVDKKSKDEIKKKTFIIEIHEFNFIF